MRTNTMILVLLAGFGLSAAGEAVAEAKNLSCISGIAPNERRGIRDCEPEQPFYIIVYEAPVDPPPPPPPPIPIKNGEGGKGSGTHGHDKDHDAPAGGGDPGGPSF